jgi:transcription initiation factor TFIIIB Brf1 subunit/transcription initiation factor TFIIB
MVRLLITNNKGETMETILKEIKAVLSFYGLPEDSVEQFARILLSQVEENKQEVQDYIDSL